jgi:hypothetical protein
MYFSLLFGAYLGASFFKSVFHILVNDYWLAGHRTVLIPHIFVVTSHRTFRINYTSHSWFCYWREHWRCRWWVKACSTTWTLTSVQLVVTAVIISSRAFFILGLTINLYLLIQTFYLNLKPLNINILRFYLRLTWS